MHSKILGICTALVALVAFAIVPAMASASPVLTESGSALATGASVTALGEETSILTGFATVECNDFWLTGTVHKNSNNEVLGTISNATFHNEEAGNTVDCSSSQGPVLVTIPSLKGQGGTKHWCIEAGGAVPADKWRLTPRNCTETTGGKFEFTLKFTNSGLTCNFSREGNIEGSFVTNASPATLKLEGTPAFSSLCGIGSLSKLNTRLYTDKATESESTSNPLTIS